MPENQASEAATLATTSAASGSSTSATSGSQAASSSPASPGTSSSPEGKPLLPPDFVFGPDGKQLKPLQLFYSQFILANIKILESLFTKNAREAADYLTYLKFLAIKGTRLQTKAILAFDQDYRATKVRDSFEWGTNLDDLSAQYLMPPWHSALTETKVAGIAAGQEMKNSVFAGTLTQMVAQIHSRAVTSTFVFTVPLLSIRASVVRAPRTLRKAKNERIV